jgi:transposase InsO family protein
MARAAVVELAALAHVALTRTRSWCADSRLARVRLRGRVDRLEQEVALLREELRIKDARLARIPAHERPRYPPHERLAILGLRAARGWSAAQTARAFLLTAATIASWMRRLDEEGEEALVRMAAPVNRFPDFVSVVVQQLRATCPSLGKVRIAQMLARAGLALSASTVRRALRRELSERPTPPAGARRAAAEEKPKPSTAPKRAVTASRPHHVWHVDLTVVPLVGGFWIPWLPYVIAQRWPFGAWVGVVLDHFSRSVVARGVFDKQPTAKQLCALLDRAVREAGTAPRHLVSDQGVQFQGEYRAWCRRRGVRPRFGAVGEHGSIAVVERFIRSLKQEALAPILVPMSLGLLAGELDAYVVWYHEHRPHQGLGGRTPREVLDAGGKKVTSRRPRAPPKRRSKMRSRRLVVSFVEARRHLPVVNLQRAA